VTNRMMESLKLFQDVINNRWFTQTNIVLFLNKRDMFAIKIKKVPLTVCFPEYKGPQEYDPAVAYILEQFKSANKSSARRSIYPHQTSATDTKNIQTVWLVVTDIFFGANLRKAGLGL
jgi:hypothetical protein